MNGKVTSRALIIALVFHAIIAFIVGIYLIGQTREFKDLIGVEILQPKERPKPKVTTYVVKPAVKPTVPMQNTVIEQIQGQPRVETIFPRESRFPTADSPQIFKPNRQSKATNRFERSESSHLESEGTNRCNTR